MNYKETIQFMYSALPMFQREGKAAYKANLNNSIAFDEYLQHPHTNYKSIHIAGTNGKGSTSHILASIFQEAGYKVGLYTSPHLKDYRERIRINGECVKKEFVIDFIKQHQSFIQKQKCSFFEMTVFMALEYFKKEKIDIAVIETGLGGRLDSTNLIKPELSIITNISKDHTQFLGDTIEKIAVEKAGIIKDNTPIIIGESKKEYDFVFQETAKNKNADIFFADKHLQIPFMLKTLENRLKFNIEKEGKILFKDLEIDLLGNYQQKNIITAVCSILHLQKKIEVSTENIYNGLKKVVKNTHLLGRWQIMDSNPLIVCDTGHNEDGVKYVIEQIKNTAYKRLHIIWGMVADKNIDKILELLPENANYYFTKAQIPRAMDEKLLSTKAKKVNLKGESYEIVNKAIKSAIENAEANDFIFIGGSTFIVAEALSYWE